MKNNKQTRILYLSAIIFQIIELSRQAITNVLDTGTYAGSSDAIAFKSGSEVIFLMATNDGGAAKVIQYSATTGAEVENRAVATGKINSILDIPGTPNYLVFQDTNTIQKFAWNDNAVSVTYNIPDNGNGIHNLAHAGLIGTSTTLFVFSNTGGQIVKYNTDTPGVEATVARPNLIENFGKVSGTNHMILCYRGSLTAEIWDGTTMTSEATLTGITLWAAVGPSFNTAAYFGVGQISSTHTLFRFKNSDNSVEHSITLPHICYVMEEIKGWNGVIFLNANIQVDMYDNSLTRIGSAYSIPNANGHLRLAIAEITPYFGITNSHTDHEHLIYSFDDLCSSLCDGSCTKRKTLTSSNCQTCISGYDKVSNDNCLVSCTSTQYRDAAEACQECPATNCTSSLCTFDPAKNVPVCTTCNTGHERLTDSSCRPLCGNTQYRDNGLDCQACPSNCTDTCTFNVGTSVVTCGSCAPGYESLSDGTCRPFCGNNQYRDNGLDCQDCPSNCTDTCTFNGGTSVITCGSCTSGYENLGNSICVAICQNSEYRDSSSQCQSCPTCCQGGCTLTGGSPTCNEVQQGFAYNLQEGCLIVSSLKFEIQISKKQFLEYNIEFSREVAEFKFSKQAFIEFEDFEYPSDYSVSITKKDGKNYVIKIETSESNFQEVFDLTIKSCKDLNGLDFPETFFSDDVNKFEGSSILGVPETGQIAVRESTNSVSEYGAIASVVSPSIISFVMPLNIAKIIPLLPIKLPNLYVGFMRMIVDFKDKDIISLITDSVFYPEALIEQRVFTMRNSVFSFTSIYSRARGLKIFFRLVANIVLIALFIRIKKINYDELQKQPNKIKKYLISFLISSLISFNHVNLSINLIYFFTTLYAGPTIADLLIVAIDFGFTGWFNYIIVKTVLKYRYKSKFKIQNSLERLIINKIALYQKGEYLKIPFLLCHSGFIVIKILTIFLLYKFPLLFAWIFILVNLGTLGATFYLFRTNNAYAKSLIIFKVSIGLESLVMTLASFLQIFKGMRKSGFVVFILILMTTAWILVSLGGTVVLFIEVYLHEKKKETFGMIKNSKGQRPKDSSDSGIGTTARLDGAPFSREFGKNQVLSFPQNDPEDRKILDRKTKKKMNIVVGNENRRQRVNIQQKKKMNRMKRNRVGVSMRQVPRQGSIKPEYKSSKKRLMK